jgi:hypothetical protein
MTCTINIIMIGKDNFRSVNYDYNTVARVTLSVIILEASLTNILFFVFIVQASDVNKPLQIEQNN